MVKIIADWKKEELIMDEWKCIASSSEPDDFSESVSSSSPAQTLEEMAILKINNFRAKVAPNNHRLYILTPTYDGCVHNSYINALRETTNLLATCGIEVVSVILPNESLITRARNNLIAKAMSDPLCTHMLFIDADITWGPGDVMKMMLSEKDLVCGIYPLKQYKFDTLNIASLTELLAKKNASPFKDNWSDADFIRYNLVRYNVNYDDNNRNIIDGLVSVRHAATGFMLLSRSIITQMMQAYPNTKYVDDVGYLQGNENDFAFALFDCALNDGHYNSEDWEFCDRWKAIGGKVYAHADVNLIHSGSEYFRGSYLASLVADTTIV